MNVFFGSDICADINAAIAQAPGERAIGLAPDQGVSDFTAGLLIDHSQPPATTTTTIIERHTHPVIERIYHTREVVQNHSGSPGNLLPQLEQLRRELSQAQQLAQEVRQSADQAQKQDKDIWRTISQMNNPGSVNTDSQTLSFSTASKALTITGGNSVDLSLLAGSGTDDQALTLSGNSLSIENGNSVDLAVYLDNTDAQSLSFSSSTHILTIAGGNSVDLSALVDGTGTDDQNLTSATLNPATHELTVSIEAGSSVTVDLTNLINDPDADITNEIQDLSLSANILTITGNASATTIDLSPYLDNTDTLKGLSCAGNEIAKWSGIEWQCAADASGTGGTDDQTIDEFQLTGHVLSLSIEGDGETPKTVDLSVYASTVSSVNGQTGSVSLALVDLSNVATTTPSDNQVLQWNGSSWVPGDKTVDTTLSEAEVDLLVSNNGYLTGYTETDPVFSAWDKSSGISITESQIFDLKNYLTSESDPIFSASAAASIINAGSGLVTTATERTNWNMAYSWGDHSSAGYLTNQSDDQTLTLATSTDSLSIENGNSVSLTDYRQALAISGNSLAISGTSTSVDLSPYLDNTDEQTISYNTTTNQLAILDGNGVDLSDLQDVYAPGNGLNLSGGSFFVNAPTCSGTDKLQWSGSAFACMSDIDTDTTYSALSQFTNDVGFLTSADDSVSGLELDGAFSTTGILTRTGSGSYATITDNTANWNTGYGWGNHALAGYLADINTQSIKNLADVYSSITPTDGQVLTFDTANGWQSESITDSDTQLEEGEVENFIFDDDNIGATTFSYTNTGANNSFIINDELGDSSPFVIDASGNVGIGTAVPATMLEVSSDTNSNILVTRAGDNTNAGGISARKSRGTIAAPTAVEAGDRLYGTYVNGHDGTSYTGNVASFQIYADENFTDTSHPTRIAFDTTSSEATSRATRMTIDSTGNVGIGTTTPTGRLQLGTDLYFLDPTKSGVDIYFTGNGYQTSEGSVFFNIDSDNNQTDRTFVIAKDRQAASGGTELFRVQEDGSVGIGTPSPGATLDVNGSIDWTSMNWDSGENILMKGDGEFSFDFADNDGNDFWHVWAPGHGAILSVQNDASITLDGEVDLKQHSLFVRNEPGSLFGMGYETQGGSQFTIFTDHVISFTESDTDVEVMRIDANAGEVGIGDTTPDAALDVVGSIHYTGTITDVSDERLKENITPLANELAGILSLQPISFTMIDDISSIPQLGFTAQNVQQSFPEAVSTIDDDFLGLDYTQLIAPIVASLKEMWNIVTGNRSEIAKMKAEYEARITNLETQLASAGFIELVATSSTTSAVENLVDASGNFDETSTATTTKTQIIPYEGPSGEEPEDNSDILQPPTIGESATSTTDVSEDADTSELVLGSDRQESASSTPATHQDIVNDDGTTTFDRVAPVIELDGNEIIELYVGEAYTQTGVRAIDDIDGELPLIIFIDDVKVDIIELDTSTTTSYHIEYKASDSAGNEVVANRTVNVKPLPTDKQSTVTLPTKQPERKDNMVDPAKDQEIDTPSSVGKVPSTDTAATTTDSLAD